jgi:ectoine hydroxylase-related dioxygenase (phytanoyl-CoA dioxygenase family)
LDQDRDIFWQPDELPKPTQDVAQLTSDMDRWGYCLIAEAVPPDQLARIRVRLEEQAEAESRLGRHLVDDHVNAPGSDNQWVLMLVNKGEVFREVLLHPLVRSVLDHVLGPEHILSETSAHLTRPGNPAMALHTDQWWMPPPVMPGETYRPAGEITREDAVQGPLKRATQPIAAPMVVQTMLMVSDFTEANGATRLVPGSHMTGKQPDQSVPHVVPSVAAEGPSGTIAIWEGRTWHSAGPNSSNDIRYGMPTLYAAPQMRTLMNFTYGTKAEVLADASPELRQLLGFKVWSGYGRTGDVGSEWAEPASETLGELKP